MSQSCFLIEIWRSVLFCLVTAQVFCIKWNSSSRGKVEVLSVLRKSPITLLGNCLRNLTNPSLNLFSLVQGRYLVQNQWPETMDYYGISLIYSEFLNILKYSLHNREWSLLLRYFCITKNYSVLLWIALRL